MVHTSDIYIYIYIYIYVYIYIYNLMCYIHFINDSMLYKTLLTNSKIIHSLCSIFLNKWYNCMFHTMFILFYSFFVDTITDVPHFPLHPALTPFSASTRLLFRSMDCEYMLICSLANLFESPPPPCTLRSVSLFHVPPFK